MTTSRKSESARANGAKSRGPITPEGKLVSSQNATQHGIFSRTMILQCESQPRFERVLAELKDQVQPRNSTESAYVETMAIARWRQMRVWAVQKTAIELEMARHESARLEAARVESARLESARLESECHVAPETEPADLTPVVLATLAYQTLSDNNFLDKLHRYETSYDRQFAKARAAILKGRRQELLEAKDLASLPSNPVASVPHLATPLTGATFMDDSDPREKVILQNEPMTQNET